MKRKLSLFVCLTCAALSLRAESTPTVDLFAGWGWSPFSYYGCHPYAGYGPYWRGYPYAGIGGPAYRLDSEGDYPYGYYAYPPFWGYEYGVRIKLNEDRYYDPSHDPLLPPLPGAAPTETRDPKKETTWQRDIEALFRSVPADAWLNTVTNAPARTPGTGAAP